MTVWKEGKKGVWTSTSIEFSVPLYKVSWSSGSSLLAVSGGQDLLVVLAEDGQSGQWSQVNLQQEDSQSGQH